MQARLLASSDWLYRQLLRSYPPAFREHFAADMAQVFRTVCREAYSDTGNRRPAGAVAARAVGLAVGCALPVGASPVQAKDGNDAYQSNRP